MKVEFIIIVGELGNKEELDKIMVDVTGATGVVKIPLSKFVYKSGDKPEPPKPGPEPEPRPEEKKEEKKSVWRIVVITLIVLVVLVGAGIAFFVVRRNIAKKDLNLTTSELDQLDRSGEYTIHKTRDDDTVHLKRD